MKDKDPYSMRNLVDYFYAWTHQQSETPGNFKNNLKRTLKNLEEMVLIEYEADQRGISRNEYLDELYSQDKRRGVPGYRFPPSQ
jgi:hypothetical protein